MTVENKLDPAIMAQFTGSETFYRYGLAGDVLFTQGVKELSLILGDGLKDQAAAVWA